MPFLGKLIDQAIHQAYYAPMCAVCSQSMHPMTDVASQAMSAESIMSSERAEFYSEKVIATARNWHYALNGFFTYDNYFFRSVWGCHYKRRSRSAVYRAVCFKELSIPNPVSNL